LKQSYSGLMPKPRDYAGEMDAVLTQFTSPEESYVLRDVAAKVMAWCEENDPDLLEGWLKLQAQDMIFHTLSRIEQSTRHKSERGTKHAVFAAALASAANGDYAPAKEQLSILDARYAVGPKSDRKKYRSMTKTEVLAVAGNYGRMEKHSKLRRMFHEMVAEHLVEGEVVGDKFTATQLYNIQRELGID
jgi:hypothetical protein